MKKILRAVFFAAAMIFIAAGCNQGNENNAGGTSDENVYSGEVSEIDGTYSGDGQTLVFDRGKMEIFGAASSARAVSAEQGQGEAVYSFTVNSEDKIIKMQLTGLFWTTDENAISYDEYVKKAKAEYASLKSTLTDTLKNDEAYKSVVAILNNAVPKDTGIDTLIDDKIEAYLTEQEKILEDYLTKKYNSKLVFGYELSADGKTLKLTQKFQGDLEDASADFSSSDVYEVKLNDYENLKPFSITLASKSFIGVPEISENAASLTAALYPYVDLQSQTGLSEEVTEIMKYISTKLSDQTEIAAVAFEALNGKTTTLENWIDDVLDSLIFNANLTVDSETPEVTLTASADFAPAVCNGAKFAAGTEIRLSYNPILSKEWTKTETE